MILWALDLTCNYNSCNMGTHGLPNVYTLSPRDSGIHIRQTTRIHVTTTT